MPKPKQVPDTAVAIWILILHTSRVGRNVSGNVLKPCPFWRQRTAVLCTSMVLLYCRVLTCCSGANIGNSISLSWSYVCARCGGIYSPTLEAPRALTFTTSGSYIHNLGLLYSQPRALTCHRFIISGTAPGTHVSCTYRRCVISHIHVSRNITVSYTWFMHCNYREMFEGVMLRFLWRTLWATHVRYPQFIFELLVSLENTQNWIIPEW